MSAEEEAWFALSEQLGEALLDAERTFFDLVDRQGLPRLVRDEAALNYLAAWSRLGVAHRLLASHLLR